MSLALTLVGVVGCAGAARAAEQLSPAVAGRTKFKGEADDTTRRKASEVWSRCVAGASYVEARKFVLNNDPAITKSDIGDRCMLNLGGGRYDFMLLPNAVYRDLIADALVRRDIKKLPQDVAQRTPAPMMAPKPIPAFFEKTNKPVPADFRAKSEKMMAAAMYIDGVGMCVARRDPQAVFNLLKISPTEAGEAEAFAGLSGTLGSCVDNGVAFNVDRSTLRGALAQGLYRLVNAPAVAKGSS